MTARALLGLTLLLAPLRAAADDPPDRVVLDAAACPELDVDRDELRRLIRMELASDGVREVLEPSAEAPTASLRVTVVARPCTRGASRFELSLQDRGAALVRQTSLGDVAGGGERALALAVAELVRAFWEQPAAMVPSQPRAAATPPEPDPVTPPAREPPPALVPPAEEPPAAPRHRLALTLDAGARWVWSLQPLVGAGLGVELPLGEADLLVVGIGLGVWTGSSETELGSVRVLQGTGRLELAVVTPVSPASLVLGAALELGAAHLFAEPLAPGARAYDATGWTAQALGFVGTQLRVGARTALLARAEAGFVLQSFTGQSEGEVVAGLEGLVVGVRLGGAYAP